MPFYLFSNPKNDREVVEIFFHMKDEKSYVRNGVAWQRVFTVPQGATNTRIDPFNEKDFVLKTGQKKGSVGNLLDASKEVSLKREQKMGRDPLKEKYFERYAKKRNGLKHPEHAKRDLKDKLSKFSDKIKVTLD